MDLSIVLDMVADTFGEREAVRSGENAVSYLEIRSLAQGAVNLFSSASVVVFHGTNGVAFPVALFGAALAGRPFVPLNYRLADERLGAIIEAHAGAVIVSDNPPNRGETERPPIGTSALLDGPAIVPVSNLVDPEQVAVLLYTSGTTAAPKAAILRHRHLVSYLLSTVEFASAEADECALVSVPPYHVAGLANLLSNLYAGRRIVYLQDFDPAEWVQMVAREGVTQAMVVPTMLARVVDHLTAAGATVRLPTLRTLSYGGARMPLPVLERAMSLFSGVNFVNAYGLTETSSTIALLGPDDHRAAMATDDPSLRARLSSVGRPLPGIQVEIRDASGKVLGADEVGFVFVGGEQISGEYAGAGSVLDQGWFATRDRGWLDSAGYLFIEGRDDDTIIKGGENIAPAEIEDALMRHPAVCDVAVFGVPDDEWGQLIAAAVVTDPSLQVDVESLRSFARQKVRSSRTPDIIELRTALPRTDTGKLLRRVLVADFE